MKNTTTNNYDMFMDMLSVEQEFFAENTVTIEEGYIGDNIADELAQEKELQRYIRSFNTYNL